MEWLAQELMRLLNIPSTSGEEKVVQLYLELRAESLGFQTMRQAVDQDRWNLIINPHEKPELLILSHVDTVPAILQGEDCPIKREGNIIRGRGAADAKGCVVSILEMLRKTTGDGWDWPNIPVTIALTVDEENGGMGSEVLAEGIQAKAAINLEPTELAVCPAQGGTFEATVVFSGTAAHGDVPEDGDNAISKALHLISTFKTLPWIGDTHPLLGQAGYNVQWIEGGSQHLVVPNGCEFELDLRVLPGHDIEKSIAQFQALCQQHGATVEITDVSPPFELGNSHWLVKKVLTACEGVVTPQIAGMPSWTDAENLVSEGTPCVVVGPGRLGDCHSARENIDIQDIKKMSQILINSCKCYRR